MGVQVGDEVGVAEGGVNWPAEGFHDGIRDGNELGTGTGDVVGSVEGDGDGSNVGGLITCSGVAVTDCTNELRRIEVRFMLASVD